MGGFLTFEDLSHPSWSSGEVVATLTDCAHLFIFVFSPQQQSLIGWSSNAPSVLGVKDFEIARDGNIFLRHVHSDDRFQLLNEIEQLFQQKKSLRLVYRWLRPDTERLCWLLCRAEPVRREEGLVYEGVIADITAEIQQVGGDIQYGAALFEALQTMVVILDSESRVLYRHLPHEFEGFNFGDAQFTSHNLQSGKMLPQGFSDSESGRRMKTILGDLITGKNEQFSERVRWKDRSVLLEARTLATPVGANRVLIFGRDCTDLERLETDSAQVRRAESFVQLAAGIFHNVNNALQSIVGQAATIQNHVHEPKVIQASAAAIIRSVEQAADLTQQLLAFKDSLTESRSAVDLNLAVMSAIHRVQDLLSSGTKIAVSLGTVPLVRANSQTLVEALEALFRATGELLGESPGFTVQTTSADMNDSRSGIARGTYSKLIIIPTAASMEIRQMGAPEKNKALMNNSLQEISSILSRCGADVRRERSAAGNAALAVYFPAELAASVSEPVSKLEIIPQILVVDDDYLVLETISALLRDNGYPVATADNRKSAVAIFKRHRSSLKLVLLDALLASGNTSSLLRQLHRIKPGIAIIGFSGASPPELQALQNAGAQQVLRKPVAPERLLATVRNIIAKQKAA